MRENEIQRLQGEWLWDVYVQAYHLQADIVHAIKWNGSPLEPCLKTSLKLPETVTKDFLNRLKRLVEGIEQIAIMQGYEEA